MFFPVVDISAAKRNSTYVCLCITRNGISYHLHPGSRIVPFSFCLYLYENLLWYDLVMAYYELITTLYIHPFYCILNNTWISCYIFNLHAPHSVDKSNRYDDQNDETADG